MNKTYEKYNYNVVHYQKYKLLFAADWENYSYIQNTTKYIIWSLLNKIYIFALVKSTFENCVIGWEVYKYTYM